MGELETFKKADGCNEDSYRLISELLASEELNAKAHMELEQSRGQFRTTDIERMQEVAEINNKIAYVAYDKKCFALARGTYLHVIEVYVGSDYAAMRQRAQIGLDDIRAAQTRPSSIAGSPIGNGP